MKRSSVAVAVAFALLFLAVNAIIGVVTVLPETNTDGRSLRWDRFDVLINNIRTADNLFDVTESYVLAIETGPFSFGTFDLPTGRLDAITQFAVYDGDTQLQQSCSGAAGTFCVSQSSGTYSVKYYFTSKARSGDRRSIRLLYTVKGALRSYSDGDQLYWKAVPSDHFSFPIVDSQVTVVLPSDRPPQVTASYPDTWTETIDGSTITWDAPGNLGKNGSVEVRVQYPHDPAMKKPGWQTLYDLQRSYEDNFRPIVSLLLLAVGVLVALGGSLFVIMRYLSRGRDPQAIVVPEYVTEPPSDTPPGVVGVLVDEKADMKDIMGSLLDLAQRGYIVIEQTSSGGVFGMFASTEFHFHRTDKSGLTGYEETLMRGLFPGSRQDTTLSDLRTKFYTYIPAIKQQMYNELVEREFFTRSPETTRNWWLWGGIVTMVLAAGLFWGARQVPEISSLLIAPPIGLAIAGLFAIGASDYMPAKTQKGAQEAALWRAFRAYLQNIERYTDLSQAGDQFSKYIGYAVVFGIDKEWINRFSSTLTSMPPWYFPTYMGGPWHGGYHPHSGGVDLGGLRMGGPGGLNNMSQSLTEGLNSMSSGLTKMMNDASSAMTSRPKSSGSGGGGFSGGGSHGGGGSGGGSRGFG